MRMSISITSGRSAPRERDRLLAVAGLADDLHLAGRLEHRAEARAHQRLVVGDQQPQPRAHSGSTARTA